MLKYLIAHQDILWDYDAFAPNRLLFDAIAFYTIGKHLSNQDAIDLGVRFANEAFAQTDPLEGYFIEGGGWDSSYNGVALRLAIELFSIIEDEKLKSEWSKRIIRAANWQIDRIEPSGEISTLGNTRVYPGGESFLGVEKGVDYAQTVKALYYFAVMTEDDSIRQLADRILDFHEQ